MYGKAFLEKPRKVRENLLTKMEIPEDLAGREPIITIAGSTNAVIENYRSILSYTSEKMAILTCCGKICITGKNLEIFTYDSMEMEIRGFISCIFLERR